MTVVDLVAEDEQATLPIDGGRRYVEEPSFDPFTSGELAYLKATVPTEASVDGPTRGQTEERAGGRIGDDHRAIR